MFCRPKVVALRLPHRNDAKIAIIRNLWTFWPVVSWITSQNVQSLEIFDILASFLWGNLKDIWYGRDSVVILLQLANFQSLIGIKPTKHWNEMSWYMFTMFMWHHLPYHMSLRPKHHGHYNITVETDKKCPSSLLQSKRTLWQEMLTTFQICNFLKEVIKMSN